jgi:hypothetical protein
VHFSGAYLEYDLHEQIRGDRLPIAINHLIVRF